MNPTIRELYERASELGPNERAELAGLLLESIEESEASRNEIEEAWAAETERRMAEYRAGRVKTLSWQDVRSQLHRLNR